MADNLPGKGVLGWLGRQVGYVKKAVRVDPAALPKSRPPAAPGPVPPAAGEAPQIVYREGRIEEAEHPTRPGVKLRRTVIDEVIVEPDAEAPRQAPDAPGAKDSP